VAIFAGSVLGGTFLLLVIVGQSVRVLPPWVTLLIGAPLPLLHLGMDWPDALREGGTFLVALIFLVGFSQAMSSVERARAELDAANGQLRDYAAQSEELATARERNRIAREIHDGLGDYLTTIHMQIQAARSILDTDRTRADARKHAQATAALLTLDFGDARLVRLTVADDGCGADITNGGFGLIGLCEVDRLPCKPPLVLISR
jgi:signal transduction histidine kinase